jgi:hypothetical protein
MRRFLALSILPLLSLTQIASAMNKDPRQITADAKRVLKLQQQYNSAKQDFNAGHKQFMHPEYFGSSNKVLNQLGKLNMQNGAKKMNDAGKKMNDIANQIRKFERGY